MKKLISLISLLVLFGQVERSWAINIVLNYLGGTPPTNSIGTGNLTNIMSVAAAYWTNRFRDPNFTLTVNYGWTTNNSISTGHILDSQGGSPNRETACHIWFLADNNTNHFMYYLDPTPDENEEYVSYTEGGTNLGGGYINCSRYFSGGPVGPTDQHVDLETVAKYEMGHALGLGVENRSFQNAITNGNSIVITAPRQFAGTVVPIGSNNNGIKGNIAYISDFRILMGGSIAPGERVLPSQLDIATLAQISGFTNVDYGAETYSPLPVLNISAQRAGQGNNMVTLSWNRPLFGTWVVQRCSDLRTSWTPVQTTITETNGVYSASVPVTGTVGFFRLKQQL